jgi:hypothetical protein
MRVRTISAAVAGVALLAGALAGASVAAAATSVTITPRTVLGSAGEQNVVPLGTISLSMTSTQTAYVVSVMRVNSATIRTLFDNEIVCKGPNGWSKNMVTGQNVYRTGSGSPQWEDVTLTTRYLVHPGVAGTVTCTANIRTVSLGVNSSTVRLVSGSLRFADQSINNAVTGLPLQQSVSAGLYKVDAATPTVRLPALNVFNTRTGLTGLSVFGDTEYMVCPSASSCNKTGSSKARFTLYVNQWKSDGTLCHTDKGTTVTRTVPYWVHHIYIPLHKPDFTVYTGDGCIPRFNAYVKVNWLGGQAGAVQGKARNLTNSRGSTSTHDSDMSHIYAIPY